MTLVSSVACTPVYMPTKVQISKVAKKKDLAAEISFGTAGLNPSAQIGLRNNFTLFLSGTLLGDLVSNDTTRGYTSITRRPINNFVESGLIFHEQLNSNVNYGFAAGIMGGRSRLEEIRLKKVDYFYDYTLQSLFLQPYFDLPIAGRFGVDMACKFALNKILRYRTNDPEHATYTNFRSTHLNVGFNYRVFKRLYCEVDLGYFNQSKVIRRRGVKVPASPSVSFGLFYKIQRQK